MVAIGRQVIVIGGGMTAVDAAVQAKKLGAREVTMVYRRGESAMKASQVEIDWARSNGVSIRHWSAPKAIVAEQGHLQGITFAVTHEQDGKLVETGETFTLSADRGDVASRVMRAIMRYLYFVICIALLFFCHFRGKVH
jgi:glutamate synthase (NADPH/NADH) small chain